MGTKSNPAPNDCYAAAEPDEPLFVLLARDPLGGHLVSIWAALRMADTEKALAVFNHMTHVAAKHYFATPDVEKGIEAMDCSAAMFAWRAENRPAATGGGDGR